MLGREARSAIGSYGRSDKAGYWNVRNNLPHAAFFTFKMTLIKDKLTSVLDSLTSQYRLLTAGLRAYLSIAAVPPSVGVGISFCSDRANSKSANAHTIGNEKGSLSLTEGI